MPRRHAHGLALPVSVLAAGAATRLTVLLPVLAGLWLLVAWALADGP